ncbi:hypothetical protein [Streptomyces lushanensis]|uniref:hypothetical protein n=1 Tax=Streptomyces lushanensis TaxID=1434255 RepID=UPI000833571D|nr:hypothetical protein [Streptomyces lushanensis]
MSPHQTRSGASAVKSRRTKSGATGRFPGRVGPRRLRTFRFLDCPPWLRLASGQVFRPDWWPVLTDTHRPQALVASVVTMAKTSSGPVDWAMRLVLGLYALVSVPLYLWFLHHMGRPSAARLPLLALAERNEEVFDQTWFSHEVSLERASVIACGLC